MAVKSSATTNIDPFSGCQPLEKEQATPGLSWWKLTDDPLTFPRGRDRSNV